MAVKIQHRPQINFDSTNFSSTISKEETIICPHMYDGCFGHRASCDYNKPHRHPKSPRSQQFMRAKQFKVSGARCEDIPSNNKKLGLDALAEEYLKLQSHGIKNLLNKHQTIILNDIGPKVQSLICHRNQEIARATKKVAKMQRLLAKLESVSMDWQKSAQDKEETIASLKKSLEELKQRLLEEDAGSRCDESALPSDLDDVEGAAECRLCNLYMSSVVCLPCRHLSSCKQCSSSLECCMVCGMAKMASIDVLIQ